MEALVQFSKRIDSIIDNAYQGKVTLLGFLDEAMQGILIESMKYHEMIKYEASGGIENSDRKRYIIAPADINNLSFKIVIFKIIYNKKFYELSHRAILGSLMALGIKRECIGDIVINDNGAYFAATEEIASFILEELHYIGKCSIELAKSNDIVVNEIKYEDKTHFLASLRLDCVIASAYNISRSEAQNIIKDGLAFVNQVNTLNVTHALKENDIVSVRHKGKFRVTKIGLETKSGRIATIISKRV